MGRQARLQDALIRERTKEIESHEARRRSNTAERQRRLLVKEYRDNKAITAWDTWASRNRHLPDARRQVLPVRIYKLQGCTSAEIARLRDIHRTRSQVGISSRQQEESHILSLGLIGKLAYVVCLTVGMLLAFVCFAAAICGFPTSRLASSFALLIAALISLSTALQTSALRLIDFNILISGPVPQHWSIASKQTTEAKKTSGQNVDGDDQAPQGSSRRKSNAGQKRSRGSGSPSEPPPKKTKGLGDSNQDGGDDDDRQEDNSSRNNKKSARSVKRKVSDDAEVTDVSSKRKMSTQAPDSVQSSDPSLANLARIQRHLNKIKLQRVVKPLVTAKGEMTLQSKLSQAAVAGAKVYRPMPGNKSRTTEGQNMRLRFSFSDSNKEAPDTMVTIPLSMLPDNVSETELDVLHAEFAKFHTSWSYSSRPAANVKLLWIPQALTNVFADPAQIEQVRHSNTLTYQCQIHYVNPDTGKHGKMTMSATATDQAMRDVIVPPLPALTIIEPQTKKRFFPTSDNPHHIDGPKGFTLGKGRTTSQAAQHKAEDAVYWISSQLQGMVATEDRMKELADFYRAQIGLSKGKTKKSGIYGGEADLCSFSYVRNRHCTWVSPTTKVASDIGIYRHTLRLIIHSLNASRVTPVMETVLQRFCDGEGIVQTWIESARIADAVKLEIEAGVPPSSACDCSDDEALREMHICEGCARAVLCKTRSFDSMGRLVCPSCLNRDSINYNGGRDPTESLASYYARVSLRRTFDAECASRKLDAKDSNSKTIFNKAWDFLKARLPGKGNKDEVAEDMAHKFVDEWTGKSHEISNERRNVGNNPSRRRYLPNGLVVDAVHSQGPPSQRNFRHSAGNIVITTNACNMAKSVFPVGVIHEVAAFLRDDKRSSDAAKEALVNKIQDMTTVKVKAPYIRQGKGKPDAKSQKIISELIAGKPTQGENGPWEKDAQRYIHGKAPASREQHIWSDEAWQKSQECAKSIEKYFGVPLFKLEDGTLWMGKKYSNPEDLNCDSIAMLCKERLERMRVKCNKKHKTRDTDLTLYREILFQYCASVTTKPELQWLKDKYSDRLGLPLVLWLNNPLRFSVAHRLHGFGMFSGWLDEDSTNAEDRIKNDEENNMLIESWLVNGAKIDMAEDYYPMLDEILGNVKIPKEFYNPKAKSVSIEVVPASKVQWEGDVSGIEFTEGDDQDPETVQAQAGESNQQAAKPSTPSGDLPDSPPPDAPQPDAPPPDDSDEEMTGQDEGSEMNTAVTNVYRLIVDDEKLRNVLVEQPEVQRLLASLRRLADGPNTDASQSEFNGLYTSLMNEYLFPEE